MLHGWTILIFNKKSNVSTKIKALQWLKTSGLKVICDFIISGDYRHTDFEILESFIQKHEIELPVLSIPTPLPGTPLFKRMKHQFEIWDLAYYFFPKKCPKRPRIKKHVILFTQAFFKNLHKHINKTQ